ncbi:CLUMA_CG010711, isoform A [Clunio marinus]|uniref:CLUMA_CG010711, isoform A n=1 Tax=Clunio marinus TaxID=568069 RepID=A0A1J1IAK5_9DIPT|nr:CLUMA_CG010711, isoform A [Clunio marinus]
MSSVMQYMARRRFVIVSSILLLLISNSVTCRPSTHKSNKLQSIGFQKAYDTSAEDSRIEMCNQDVNLNEMCQRCEKSMESKTGDVFAMCCSNEDQATDFCRKYVYYGVTT